MAAEKELIKDYGWTWLQIKRFFSQADVFFTAGILCSCRWVADVGGHALDAILRCLRCFLQAEFGWSKTLIAAAFALTRIESGILGPLQGWLVDRYGLQADFEHWYLALWVRVYVVLVDRFTA